MKLRSFIYVMGFVALIAVIYSPSTIGVEAGSGIGTTSPSETSQGGASQFLSSLKQSGYHVVLVNDTQTEQRLLLNGKSVFMLLGADLQLSQGELQSIRARYQGGQLSILLAEGNTTNAAFLGTVFGATVSGAAIYDRSSPFKDQRIFTVTLKLGATTETGVIDIASPIQANSGSVLRPVATSSANSFDALDSRLGARTVVATGTNVAGSRTVLITDSAPFTNYLFGYNQSANEKAFVGSMVDWVTHSNRSQTVLYDNYHYRSAAPKFSLGIPVGPIVAYVLAQLLSGVNSYYGGLPAQTQGFFQNFGISIPEALARVGIAMLLLLSVYGAVRRWFAPEMKGKDDQPIPSVERSIVAESKSRIDFLTTSRNKSFYVATLARLYEVFDDIMTKEFGFGVSSVSLEELQTRFGARAGEAFKLFADLRRVYEYANGKRRFLFPPVFRWKSRVSTLTTRAEETLNQLGITITGSSETKEKVEYAVRGR
ncbi:MAG: hypothetical protein E6K90_05655 [Thaumarchaeota archaeon]|nr:MAG: hypothetical protein E6K90_05655 [Nitrososphaerota archaeon]